MAVFKQIFFILMVVLLMVSFDSVKAGPLGNQLLVRERRRVKKVRNYNECMKCKRCNIESSCNRPNCGARSTYYCVY